MRAKASREEKFLSLRALVGGSVLDEKQRSSQFNEEADAS